MRICVCLIDDEPLVRDSMALSLNDMGYEVIVAEGGFEGINAIERGRPDVVVTDWNMPGISGEDLLLLMRARFPHLPILVTSGGSQIDARAVLRLGADQYLPKPFRPRDLSAAIELARQKRDAHAADAIAQRVA